MVQDMDKPLFEMRIYYITHRSTETRLAREWATTCSLEAMSFAHSLNKDLKPTERVGLYSVPYTGQEIKQVTNIYPS